MDVALPNAGRAQSHCTASRLPALVIRVSGPPHGVRGSGAAFRTPLAPLPSQDDILPCPQAQLEASNAALETSAAALEAAHTEARGLRATVEEAKERVAKTQAEQAKVAQQVKARRCVAERASEVCLACALPALAMPRRFTPTITGFA